MKDTKVTRKSASRPRKAEPVRKRPVAPRAPDLEKAIEEYGAALRSFQKKDLGKAKEQFDSLIERYPKERELLDRARTYAQICERLLQPPAPRLKDASDYYHQGVFLMNQASHEEAIRMLDKALSLEPDNERILYVHATALALMGRREDALGSLRRAIAQNGANRAHAARDADFEGLRDHEEFRRLVHGDAGASA